MSEHLQWWNSFREGSETALRRMMQQYYGPMLNYGSKFSKNHAFVKDCIQDVFIALWQYRESLATPQSLKAYLLTSLRRKIFSNRPGTGLVLLNEDPSDQELFAFEPSPEASVIEEESLAVQCVVVAGLLEKLSDRQREVIYLKFYQGLDRDEIAGIMGLSHQSVSNLLQKAIHSLRKIIPSGISLLTCLFFIFGKQDIPY